MRVGCASFQYKLVKRAASQWHDARYRVAMVSDLDSFASNDALQERAGLLPKRSNAYAATHGVHRVAQDLAQRILFTLEFGRRPRRRVSLDASALIAIALDESEREMLVARINAADSLAVGDFTQTDIPLA